MIKNEKPIRVTENKTPSSEKDSKKLIKLYNLYAQKVYHIV